MRKKRLLFLLLLAGFSTAAQTVFTTDVLIIGGGTSGISAGIQSSRLGAKTIIAEPTTWLGGMISAAGVSAIDGNNKLPSGIWSEFRNQLYKVYGGPKAVETGWVSNTLFEPHVADSIFKRMAGREKNLKIFYRFSFQSLIKTKNKITAAQFINAVTGRKIIIVAKVYIDATELGDVIKAAGIPYDLGMEADSITKEGIGVTETNSIVQDLTYVATLKDYGVGADKTISKPVHYDPAEFDGACTDYYVDKTRKAPTVDARKMLEYGKLPHDKYMINWPIYGNDTYLNVVELNESQRAHELVKAKETTLRFVYFIQHELGFKHLGLADDEFPTRDKLAIIPYYREGRRVKGLVRFTMRHISEPFTYGEPLYRTGIAVGDYPIDHHHKKNLNAPQHLSFYPIPSFSIPLGTLIPQNFDNLIVAEKGISVSNVANGTTRLQPCVLLIGQAAGTLAGLSIEHRQLPKNISVRDVQQKLLQSKAYIMPYFDVTPENPHFESIQKVGATGILRGKGMSYKWANQTWFYPDSLVSAEPLIMNANDFKKGSYFFSSRYVTIKEAFAFINQLSFGKKFFSVGFIKSKWGQWGLKNFNVNRNITREELAVLLDKTIDPFKRNINFKGLY